MTSPLTHLRTLRMPESLPKMGHLLVSRELPAPQAVVQRRRAWLEQQKMIDFLTAADLIGMLEMRENGEEPFEVVDAQLEEFFRTLSL